MKIQTRKLKEFLVVAVIGELNDDNSMELKHSVQKNIQAGEAKIVLDFSKVSFATSFAIGVIVHLWKAVGEKGGSLYLLGRSVFRQDLENLNLHRIVRMFATEAEFMEALGSGVRSPLRTQVRREGPFTVVKLLKPDKVMIDLKAFSRDLDSLTEGTGAKVALDLSNLEYFDSEMIALIAAASKKLAGRGGGLTLTGLSEDHLHSLRQAGLNAIARLLKAGEPLPPA